MTTVNIPARSFAAALKCAAKCDVRFYLNSVYLDFPKGRIVATDGHKLFAAKIGEDQILSDMPAVIVPRELIESALKSLSKRDRDNTDIAITVGIGEVTTVELHARSGMFRAPAVEAKYPDYERIFPHKLSGEIAQYNPELLLACMSAMRLYTGSTTLLPQVQHNGDSAALITGADCLCIVMPFRADTIADAAWFTGPVQEVAIAA